MRRRRDGHGRASMNLGLLLVFHITAGSVGLAAGAVALFTRKGAALHRMAGNAFFIAMILMAVAGGVVAVLKPAAAAFNVVVAALTTYMVVTSWVTVQRKDREAGVFEFVALAAALAIAAGGVLLGLEAAKSPDGIAGIPDFLFYGFAVIATLAALADVSVIVRGGLAGAQRIARHLWRMCSALFLGTLAFFVGQGTNVFPLWVRETGLLPAPMLIVLVVAIFWLVRVLTTDWYVKGSNAPANR